MKLDSKSRIEEDKLSWPLPPAVPPSSSFEQTLNGHSLSLLNNEERLVQRSTACTRSHPPGHPQLVRMESSSHKGSIYNYRQAVKSMIRVHQQQQQQHYDAVSETTTESRSDSSVHTRYEIVVAPPAVVSAAEKRLERARQAREKILNATPAQRVNLNKMTILAPFEQTKILVNLDKVPANVWHCLVNKNFSTPKYFIPPARAYGFFKTTNHQSNSTHHPHSAAPAAASAPPPPPSTQDITEKANSNKSSNPKSVSRVSFNASPSGKVRVFVFLQQQQKKRIFNLKTNKIIFLF